MIDEYLRELSRELDAVGVRGADARRLLSETGDHLSEAAAEGDEDDAVLSFGPAHELAARVADELATVATRAAAVAAFAALAVGGAAYAALFLTLPYAGSPDVSGGSVPGLGVLAFAGIVFLPQLAFVSGCLALVRVSRLRSRGALPAAELRVQRWRTGVALGAGALTFVSLLIAALDFRRDLAPWWVGASVGASALLLLVLGAVGLAAVRSTRPRAGAEGSAENVFDDLVDVLSRVPGLRRAPLPRAPRRLALLVALVAATGVATAGVAGADPLDGLVRALAEGVAVLGCYAALGRRLGLR